MVEPEAFRFGGNGAIPNSRLPLLVYRQAAPANAAEIERLFTANLWPAAWRNGVYPFHHFHAQAHEALGVARGWASVLFGGPAGEVVRLDAGDVAVIPAGVGHCAMDASADLLIVGAYPAGSARPDLRRGRPPEESEVLGLIAAVSLPQADPVAGRDGPLTRLWADRPPIAAG